MKSLLTGAVCAALALFLFLPAAKAAPVTLSSAEAGYAISLPDGWEELDTGPILEGSPDPVGISPEAAKKMRETIRMARKERGDGEGLLTFAVAYTDYEAMGLDRSQAGGGADSPLAKTVRTITRMGLESSGMTVLPAANPVDGVGMAASLDLEGDFQVYSLQHQRFTRDHVISASAGCLGPKPLSCADEAKDILSILVIDAEQSLGPPPSGEDSLSTQ